MKQKISTHSSKPFLAFRQAIFGFSLCGLMLAFLTPNVARAQGEVSVDKFTGTAFVTLPLYTVQAGGVSFPVALTYAATGVQVTDPGGLVGTNWSLSGDLRVSREVRGLPDDVAQISAVPRRFGWLRRGNSAPASPLPATVEPACSAAEATALAQIQALEGGGGTADIFDTEPDIFSYNLPGHTGKFAFDASGTARTMPFDPISITYTLTGPGMGSITIKTPEGNTYLLDVTDTFTKQYAGPAAMPRYFQHDYKLFKDGVTFVSAWHVSKISTATNEEITFTYVQSGITEAANTLVRRLYWGAGSVSPVEEYKATNSGSTHWLNRISSPATIIDFFLATGDLENSLYLSRVEVYSAFTGIKKLIKTYKLSYIKAKPAFTQDHKWYDKDGAAIDESGVKSRPFLRMVRVLRPFAPDLPPYTFSYSGLVDKGTIFQTTLLPPSTCAEQDYWGYYNANGAKTLVPKLFVYPGMSPAVPGWPYRLFANPNATAIILDGADRRPAQDFAQALAGTLTDVKLPAGGQITLEYEPHQFFDAVANATVTGGGMRIRAVRYKDNITRTEQKRAYLYAEEASDRTSGRLLHAPRFAFTVPSLAAGDPQTQWNGATVRGDEDLSTDAFESRNIGYGQVVEKVTGRGRSIYTYGLFATVDDDAVGSEWMRTRVGIARAANPSTGNCPSVGSVVNAGMEQYPFPASTNNDFRRGLVQNVVHKAEPTASGEATVRTETFAYKLVLPGVPIAAGTYERLGTSDPVYAYAGYALLGNYQYSVVQSGQVTNDQQGAGQAETMAVAYGYNAQGWPASVVRKNSDNVLYRTRYKYLSDYNLTAAAPGPVLLAMATRNGQNGITNQPVETISEVKRGNEVKMTAITLQTYRTVGGQTVPYQAWRWQPALAVSRGAYDSTWVHPMGSGNELTFDRRLRLVSTVQATDVHLRPLTVLRQTGRQLEATHLGYSGTLPILKITQAGAQEVLFSDFETATDFYVLNTNSYGDPGSARTGTSGLLLQGSASIEGTLPESAAPVYKLSLWAKTSGGTSITVKVLNASNTAVWQQNVNVAATNAWNLYFVNIDLATLLGTSSRANCRISISTAGPVNVDDVLFLPSTASAASITYDPVFGKTSETDGRGRTTFYEYNSVGELALVRDHNGAIVQKLASSYGNSSSCSANFTYTGGLTDLSTVNFSTASVYPDGTQYTWNFGDPTSGQANTDAGVSASHVFNTGDTEKDYAVTLSITTPQGQNCSATDYVHIIRKPLAVDLLAHGLVYVDACATPVEYRTVAVDSSPLPANKATQYRALLRDACFSAVTYEWQKVEIQNVNWTTIASGTSSIIEIPFPTTRRGYKVRCIVRACNKQVTTAEFVFQYLGNTGCQP